MNSKREKLNILQNGPFRIYSGSFYVPVKLKAITIIIQFLLFFSFFRTQKHASFIHILFKLRFFPLILFRSFAYRLANFRFVQFMAEKCTKKKKINVHSFIPFLHLNNSTR